MFFLLFRILIHVKLLPSAYVQKNVDPIILLLERTTDGIENELISLTKQVECAVSREFPSRSIDFYSLRMHFS